MLLGSCCFRSLLSYLAVAAAAVAPGSVGGLEAGKYLWDDDFSKIVASSAGGGRARRCDSRGGQPWRSRVWPPAASAKVQGEAATADADLLVLLRGEVFRRGGQGGRSRQDFPEPRSATDARILEQRHALESVQRHVLRPALAAGWRVTLVLDVYVNASSAPPLDVVQEVLSSLSPAAVRVAPRQLASQPLSWLATLARFASSPSWRAVLVVRADLYLKRDLPFVAPSTLGDAVLVPFAICHRRCNASLGEVQARLPRVADTLLLVPRSRHMDVVMALYRHAGCPWWIGLHNLPAWVRGPVDFLLPSRHDSDSEKQWNPLYRIIGRPEAPRGDTEATCFPCHTESQAEFQHNECFRNPAVTPRDLWHHLMTSLADRAAGAWEPNATDEHFGD